MELVYKRGNQCIVLALEPEQWLGYEFSGTGALMNALLCMFWRQAPTLSR